jgi:hypothetical protein
MAIGLRLQREGSVEEGSMSSLIIRRLSIAGLAVAALLVACSVATADEIGIYDLQNLTFVGGGTAAGSFSYDFTTNQFTGIDVSTQGTSGTPAQLFTLGNFVNGDFGYSDGWCAGCSPSGDFDEFAFNNGTDQLWLDVIFPTSLLGTNPLLPDLFDLNISSDLGYSCTNAASGMGCYFADGVATGALTGVVSTPEPSAGLLLLIGCLALAAFPTLRKQLRCSPAT